MADSSSNLGTGSMSFLPAKSRYKNVIICALVHVVAGEKVEVPVPSPNETCTNAQVITFIWRACGEPDPIIDNIKKEISGFFMFFTMLLPFKFILIKL